MEADMEATKENNNTPSVLSVDDDVVIAKNYNASRPKIRRGLANLIPDTSVQTDHEIQSSDAVYTSISSKIHDKQALKQRWIAMDQAKQKLALETKKQEKVTRQKIVVRDNSPSPPPPINVDSQTATEIDMEINSLIMQHKVAMEYYNANKQRPDSPDVIEVDDLVQESTPNEKQEINVKLRWKGVIKRFPMKKVQPFQYLISKLATENQVAESRIMLCLNDTNIPPHETPKSVHLTIADIIEGYQIVEGEIVEIADAADSMELKVQSKASKAPKIYKIRKGEPLSNLARMYALDNKCDVGKVSFSFDGDSLDLENTPDDLELEDGFCIDAKILSD